MCLKAGTCMSILQSFQSCPSAVSYHFPLGVRLFHSRHQKNIRKGTTLLLEGSLGDARLSDLASFFCPITSSTISYQMHLLHISLSLERCCYMKKHPWGIWLAQGRMWQSHPSLPRHYCPMSVCSWCVPHSLHGDGRVWLTSGLSFSPSDLDFLRGWILGTAREWISEINLQCGRECYPNTKSPLPIQIAPKRRGTRATRIGQFWVKTSDLH